jgi:anti-sigma factor RsiW
MMAQLATQVMAQLATQVMAQLTTQVMAQLTTQVMAQLTTQVTTRAAAWVATPTGVGVSVAWVPSTKKRATPFEVALCHPDFRRITSLEPYSKKRL